MIKAVIFDAYGTLISTGNGSIEATRKMLNELNILIDPGDFYKEWKTIHKNNIANMKIFEPEHNIFIRDLRILFEKYSIHEMPEKAVSFMIHSLTGRKVFSDTNDVLNSLSKKYTICIGSTSDTKPLLENIKENNIKIDYVFTSQSLKIYKPKKEFYEKILSTMQILSSEAVFVGDSLIDDVMGPQKLGIYSIWLDRSKAENKTNIKPNATIFSLYGLIDILNNFK